jgi:hypothetical protein
MVAQRDDALIGALVIGVGVLVVLAIAVLIVHFLEYKE